MSEIKSIRLPNGSFLCVEMIQADIGSVAADIEGAPSDLPEGAEPVGFKEDVIDTLQVLKNNLATIAATVHEGLQTQRLAEWTLQLNIGFKGKTSPIPVLLSGQAEGAIKVTATWRRAESGE